MSKYDDTFILVKDSDGERYLCPIDAVRSDSTTGIDDIDDCVEEDVVGRYAGNIHVKTS
jgi:hypothetical protein